VGQILIQLARLRGSRVLATVGSLTKARVVTDLGAEVILYQDVDFVAAVLEATNGQGVDVVYDNVGKTTFSNSLKCLKRRGTCVLTGGPSGHVESLDPLELAEAGSLYLTRPHMADYMSSAEEIAERASDVFKYIARGVLKLNIDRTYPLAEASSAHRDLEGRRTAGKVLLNII